MIRSNKNKGSKKVKSRKKRNPDVRGSYNEAAGFQDVRLGLGAIIGHDESDGMDAESPVDHLEYVLSHFKSHPQPHERRNSLTDYRLEIFTPEVKRSMKIFARDLRKSVIEVANEYGIDSLTSEFAK